MGGREGGREGEHIRKQEGKREGREGNGPGEKKDAWGGRRESEGPPVVEVEGVRVGVDVEQGVGMPPDEPADLGGPKF